MAGTTVSALVRSAHPTLMLGIAVEFGDSVNKSDVGVTAKVVSTNRPNQFVVGAGVGYFPWSVKPLGFDLDAGYNFNHVGVLAGYDFVRFKPQVSAGWVPTDPGELYCVEPYPVLSGTSCETAPSDRRLKRDVVHLATLSDGLRLYSFRYLWSDVVHVGVMAQDLLEDPRWRHAVITDADGYYSVDYDQIELAMVTIEIWNEYGLDAMVLGSRRPELAPEEQAA
jgi:Chaperone of endosialidase